MEKRRFALRFGCPVRFRDRWQGRLSAVEVDDEWEVLNVVIRRGLLRAASVRLPFSIAREWSDELMGLECGSEEAFARKVPPVAAPATALSTRSAVSSELRLRGLIIDKPGRRATHVLLSAGGLLASERAVATEEVSLRGGTLTLAVQPERLTPYRSDEQLLREVQRALAAHPHLTGEDRRGLRADVVDGAVYLSGNVRSPQGKLWAAAAAASIVGRDEVQDAVADDLQLEIDLGQALDRAGLFRQAQIYVRSALGEVTLSGSAPPGAAADIERIVSSVPGVRSVTSRFEVRAAPPPPPPPPRPAEAPEPEEPKEPVAPG